MASFSLSRVRAALSMDRIAVAVVVGLALGFGSGCQGRLPPPAAASAPVTADGFTLVWLCLTLPTATVTGP
jgi:hypothetical protein